MKFCCGLQSLSYDLYTLRQQKPGYEIELVVETIIFQEKTSVTNGLKWLPYRQSDDIANVEQTELIYARLLQSVVKLPSVIPAGRQCNWRSYIVDSCFVVSCKSCR
jgi:hypothetical protein